MGGTKGEREGEKDRGSRRKIERRSGGRNKKGLDRV